MPGFNITGGENNVGTPSAQAELRRTHRWMFETCPNLPGAGTVLVYLKTAARPSFTLEEALMHHNQEVAYFAGKQTWEPITMTWYDAEQKPNVSKAIANWVNVCSDWTSINVAPPSTYKAPTSSLLMQNGAGGTNEKWEIYNGWPQQSNFQNLDMTSSEIQTIEVKFRYDRANRVL